MNIKKQNANPKPPMKKYIFGAIASLLFCSSAPVHATSTPPAIFLQIQGVVTGFSFNNDPSNPGGSFDPGIMAGDLFTGFVEFFPIIGYSSGDLPSQFDVSVPSRENHGASSAGLASQELLRIPHGYRLEVFDQHNDGGADFTDALTNGDLILEFSIHHDAVSLRSGSFSFFGSDGSDGASFGFSGTITSISGTARIPDSGGTLSLLGGALSALALARVWQRNLRA